MTDYAWTPPADARRRFRVGELLTRLGGKKSEVRDEIDGIDWIGRRIATAGADPARFWPEVVDHLDIPFTAPFREVVDLSRGPQWADWFVGGELNLAAACIDRPARGSGADRAAIVAVREDGVVAALSRRELAAEVARCAAALARAGIVAGDRVAAFMPTSAEVAIQMFATIRLGAIFVPVFSGFGAEALAERLRDCEAKLLFTADTSFRRGEPVPILPAARRAAGASPSVGQIVVVERSGAAALGEREISWQEFLGPKVEPRAALSFPAMHPALLLYTSGTTGRPKGTVHSHAGTLVNTAKEHGYAFDLRADDVFFWLTDIGWMMGPWLLIGGLFHGATVVLFEGAIDWPTPERLWEICAAHGVSILGVSPTAVRLLRKLDAAPRGHDLSRLRILGSTGEAWDEASWHWFFREAGGERCPVINISGGTDLMGCWLSPTPLHPLKPASLGGPGLGMSVDVWNEAGESVRGEVGYLVATRPAPSMTRGLWKDPARYLESYWSKWPGIWNHGDWATVDGDGQWFLRGRADDTLKIAGKRLGPSEVEGALIATGMVSEAAAIGIPDELKGEAIAAFVVLRPGVEPTEELRTALAAAVADQLGKVARPREVRFVGDLPKTRSAKILRRVVRAVRLGETGLGDLSTLANPEAIDAVRQAF
ncbi:MAG: AMP-binding protein [Thermoanaerobaculia bacterium]|nr:AMP-binding protein [Thermoanaerobaculia bacterium]MBP9826048.1 AMP-binding protein [Thermoanaerobaculia bacterium]